MILTDLPNDLVLKYSVIQNDVFFFIFAKIIDITSHKINLKLLRELSTKLKKKILQNLIFLMKSCTFKLIKNYSNSMRL